MTHWLPILGLIAMAPGGGDGGTSGLGGMAVPLIIIAVMFYFILYMPEKKRKQQREKMLSGLDRGVEVITTGGIYGRITALTDKNVTLEIAPNVRIKVARQFISGPAKEGADSDDKGRTDKKGKKDKDD
jgi:preprotein translocase subunit YajC